MDNRIVGVHAVYEALTSSRQPIERIHIAREAHSGKVKELLDLARERGVPVRKEERSILDRMAQGQIHQGVVAISGEVSYADFKVLLKEKKPLVVVLDGVEDPHNLGAVIRTAEACKASGVVVPERHSAPLSATVVKASAGASAHLPVVRVKNLASAIDELKERGLWVVGVDPSGTQDWTSFDYTGPVALVLGGEHKGLRRLVREHCDVLVRLPMLGKIASLNISVAAGVVLYEVVRQRQSA
ncbi:MAG TPA: 23S rRNA (guanosine(2251)-2'-O)-methyltransferase RlmB [Terriglobia bacterium]|nr:23S rRNA (guanosine(2251)-2'-O)-methyltransferase RlmB [Terriglobia bacterium]